jgi:hypothetical protein
MGKLKTKNSSSPISFPFLFLFNPPRPTDRHSKLTDREVGLRPGVSSQNLALGESPRTPSSQQERPRKRAATEALRLTSSSPRFVSAPFTPPRRYIGASPLLSWSSHQPGRLSSGPHGRRYESAPGFGRSVLWVLRGRGWCRWRVRSSIGVSAGPARGR